MQRFTLKSQTRFAQENLPKGFQQKLRKSKKLEYPIQVLHQLPGFKGVKR